MDGIEDSQEVNLECWRLRSILSKACLESSQESCTVCAILLLMENDSGSPRASYSFSLSFSAHCDLLTSFLEPIASVLFSPHHYFCDPDMPMGR